MQTLLWRCLATLAAVALAFSIGCPFRPPSEAGTTDFNEFVKTLLAQTSDTTEPVDLDGIEFTFNEDPSAFDDVLAQASTSP